MTSGMQSDTDGLQNADKPHCVNACRPYNTLFSPTQSQVAVITQAHARTVAKDTRSIPVPDRCICSVRVFSRRSL